jgi:hypothetical protein
MLSSYNVLISEFAISEGRPICTGPGYSSLQILKAVSRISGALPDVSLKVAFVNGVKSF